MHTEVALDSLRAGLDGRYTIKRELGRGGMATVYLAIDVKHQRQVAIKVLHPEFAIMIGPQRFVQEIEVAAKLSHSHILPLYDSGEIAGLPFYVMPYVAGESLSERLTRETQLPIDEALAITRDVASALSYAHAQEVIHRDVKPGNILLDGEKAILADFGVAKPLHVVHEPGITPSSMIVGTPEYMSPEQCTAGGKVDPRSDVYSLGCVLYEMLAGEPPFTGPTAQAIVARQMSEAPRSLTLVRSTIPRSVEYSIECALAKVPADRPETAERFVGMLDEPPPATAEVQARSRARKRTWATSTALVVSLLGFGLWLTTSGGDPALDDNRVIVFPMVETGIGDLPDGIGEMAAFGIGSALEEAAPLKWEDGWLSLDDQQRADVDMVTSDEKDTLARAAGARYRLDGSIVTTGDSASIILWLYDVKADSLLQRRTVTGASTDASVMRLAIVGVKKLLPVLLEPGRDIERIPLEDRDLGAVALWMQGKREYRASRFQDALGFYERAVEQDSALALAALNGAQAASWLAQRDQAEQLTSIALAHEATFPEPIKHFAKGLHAYLTGSADVAVAALRLALQSDASWAEAHMALGEVFYHLLPSGVYGLDSLAEEEFSAAAADSNFSPPLFHLAQIYIRRGELDRARATVERYGNFAPQGTILQELIFMFECVNAGAEAMDWESAVREGAPQVVSAAKALSVAGRQVDCAEGGFRAVMRDSSYRRLHWGAILGLQSVLLASGQLTEFAALVDSVTTYRPPTMTLYSLAAIAYPSLTDRAQGAAAFIGNAFGAEYQRSPSAQLSWTMGVWHASRHDQDLVRDLRDALAAKQNQRQAKLFAASLSGHLAFLDGDSTEAISKLLTLASTARADSLEWQPGESFPSAHLLLAKLLFESDRYEEAIQVASVFDHPSPIIFSGFVPVSLALRYQAAVLLGRRELVEEYHERLEALNQTDLVRDIQS